MGGGVSTDAAQSAHHGYSAEIQEFAAARTRNQTIMSLDHPPLRRGSNRESAAIDHEIARQKLAEVDRVKILLLGSADAGKSTIVRQMRILHMNGFVDAAELDCYAKYIRSNIFQIYSVVAEGILSTHPLVEMDELGMIERFSRGIQWTLYLTVEEEICELREFGDLNCVNTFLIEHPNWPALPDNHSYFLPIRSRVLAKSFIPSTDDILNVRIPTHNINEVNFSFAKLTIRLIDVGGQHTYRKKWIHCFEGCAAVLFVASMSSYDQRVEDVEDFEPVLNSDIFQHREPKKGKNRLRDSAHLFGEMLRNTFLRSAAVILFLNKKDLFEKKLLSSKIGDHVPTYNGNNTMNDACEFIEDYFMKRKSKNDKNRKIYTHFTCATDTQNVNFVFKASCDLILEKKLKSSGIQSG